MLRFFRRLLLPLVLVAGGVVLWRNQALRSRLLSRLGLGTGEPTRAPSSHESAPASFAGDPDPRTIASAAGTAAAGASAGAQSAAQLAPEQLFTGADATSGEQMTSGDGEDGDEAQAPAAPAAPQPAMLASRPDPDPGLLDAYGDDETTNDRVLSQLGRYLAEEGLERLNINTQAGGVVYLRGSVRSQTQIDQIYSIVADTEGVGDIVSELQIEEERGE